jgi:hypothetical protein
MKLSTKNLIIIFIALAAVFVILQFTKRDNRSRSLKSELVNIDTSRVTRITIQGKEGEVSLTKNGDWLVKVNEANKKTRDGAVENLLNALNTIKPSRLAAKSKDSWKDYEVDTAGTRVTVFDGNDVLSDIVIGRFGVEGQRNFYSYVRQFEDENVYVADGFMGMSIGSKTSDFRNNQVLRVKKDSLTSITFDYPDSAFVLAKNEGQWFLGEQQADSAAVASFLQGVGYLNNQSFFDEEITVPPTHIITFSFSDQPSKEVNAFALESGFVIRTSDNDLESFSDSALNEKLLKGQNVFLPTN